MSMDKPTVNIIHKIKLEKKNECFAFILCIQVSKSCGLWTHQTALTCTFVHYKYYNIFVQYNET